MFFISFKATLPIYKYIQNHIWNRNRSASLPRPIVNERPPAALEENNNEIDVDSELLMAKKLKLPEHMVELKVILSKVAHRWFQKLSEDNLDFETTFPYLFSNGDLVNTSVMNINNSYYFIRIYLLLFLDRFRLWHYSKSVTASITGFCSGLGVIFFEAAKSIPEWYGEGLVQCNRAFFVLAQAVSCKEQPTTIQWAH